MFLRQPDRVRPRLRPAFTLIELMIVMIVIGIAFGLALPMMGDTQELRLRQAARMLAADIEFAQNESIAHPDDRRIVKFDTVDHGYRITSVNASPADTPIDDPVSHQPFLVTYGTGRAETLTDVTIQAFSLGGDDSVQFNAYGVPDQATDATITLACGPSTLTVYIAAGTGEVTVP